MPELETVRQFRLLGKEQDLSIKPRIATLSVHTCPLATHGGKETGAMEEDTLRKRIGCSEWGFGLER